MEWIHSVLNFRTVGSVYMALGQMVYCKNIPTLTKSHPNSKSVVNFFLNLHKKWSRNYTKCIGWLGVTLMGLSSLHSAYGPGDYW